MKTWIKICGVCSVSQAECVRDAGADAIGLNFVPHSPRAVSVERAREIVARVGSALTWVGVVADLSADSLEKLRFEVGLDLLQLHGQEEPGLIDELAPAAYKAVRVAAPEDVAQAANYGGDRILVDSKVKGALGGTGHSFDWRLVTELARSRPVVLAGGLRPDNVFEAVQAVRPFGVDTASGVESAPGEKSDDLVRRFVAEVRRAERECP